jgi:hypothetical protein
MRANVRFAPARLSRQSLPSSPGRPPASQGAARQGLPGTCRRCPTGKRNDPPLASAQRQRHAAVSGDRRTQTSMERGRAMGRAYGNAPGDLPMPHVPSLRRSWRNKTGCETGACASGRPPGAKGSMGSNAMGLAGIRCRRDVTRTARNPHRNRTHGRHGHASAREHRKASPSTSAIPPSPGRCGKPVNTYAHKSILHTAIRHTHRCHRVTSAEMRGGISRLREHGPQQGDPLRPLARIRPVPWASGAIRCGCRGSHPPGNARHTTGALLA